MRTLYKCDVCGFEKKVTDITGDPNCEDNRVQAAHLADVRKELEQAHKEAASLAEDKKVLLAAVEDLRQAWVNGDETGSVDWSDIEDAVRLADDAIEDMSKRGRYL